MKLYLKIVCDDTVLLKILSLCLRLVSLHSFNEFLLRNMVSYFIKVIILPLISFYFSPFIFLWDGARERKRNHTRGSSKNFESEVPRLTILRLK